MAPRIPIHQVTGGLGVALDSPESGPKPTKSLRARASTLAPPEEQLRLLASVDVADGPDRAARFERTIAAAGTRGLRPAELEIFQINLGKLCNMTCRHCHVDAGPDRIDEMMSQETLDACLDALGRTTAHTVDVTGGAPELHPGFRDLIDECVARGKHVIDRSNLTILLVPKFADLPQWLGERGVEIVASLPHYRKRNTDAQRGDGTYEKSIEALRRLNRAGYGTGDPRRVLTLMSNPAGAFLGGDQSRLEKEWKAALARNFDITFDRLLILNNMPISRFLDWLMESDNLESYMQKLVDAFNPDTLPGLMCRNTLSVSWDGRIYDCDFNQMLDIGSDLPGEARIEHFDPEDFRRRRIRTARHCYGCTAGKGSSCGGATT